MKYGIVRRHSCVNYQTINRFYAFDLLLGVLIVFVFTAHSHYIKFKFTLTLPFLVSIDIC